MMEYQCGIPARSINMEYQYGISVIRREDYMQKKYQIFISSTYEDLKDERKKVQDTILRMYHFPIGMEMFSAGNVDQWKVIRETIDSSDYYILLVGHRYGSIIERCIKERKAGRV